jgi:hypothetical protein
VPFSIRMVIRGCVSVLILLGAMAGPFCSMVVWAAPKLTEGAAPGDCAACHENEKVLPNGHTETKGLKLQECLGCHKNSEIKGKPGTLWGKVPLGHFHRLSGISCSSCHETAQPVKGAPDTQKCVSCHPEYKKGPLQANSDLQNPHDSHMGDLDCSLCHHQHKKSENFCSTCHYWKYVVP